MNKRKGIIGGVLVLILGMAAWAFGFFHRTDPAITELQQIGSQAWDKSLPEAQRTQIRQEFRQKMEGLSDDQRRAFFDANRDQWTNRMQQRMDEYFKMSKADQQKRLDEILNRIVQGRSAQQQGADGQNGQARGNRGGGRNMSDTQREQRSKDRLDRSNPRMRAQTAEFRRQLDQRAQQRGINLGNGSGWGFGPRRGV
jgi:hypothetical protein